MDRRAGNWSDWYDRNDSTYLDSCLIEVHDELSTDMVALLEASIADPDVVHRI